MPKGIIPLTHGFSNLGTNKKNFKEKWFLSPQPLHHNISHSSIPERLKCYAKGIQCDKPSLGHHVSQPIVFQVQMAVQALWATSAILTTILCSEQVASDAQRSLPMFLILKCTIEPYIQHSCIFIFNMIVYTFLFMFFLSLRSRID